MVGVVVGLGLGVVVLAIVVVLVIKAVRPETFEAYRGFPIAPTMVSTENLVPFTASFTDVASEAGVTKVQASGATGQRLLPETMGSGIVLGDFDGDEDPDLLLLSYGSTPALFRNDSPPGGPIRFTDVTEGSGLGDLHFTTTAALGDFDDDGRLDLLVGRIGSDLLMRNLGEMRFERMTELGEGWTSAAGFVDVDNDHDLDLVIASYVKWSPEIDLEVNYTLDGIGRAYGPPTGFEGTDLALHLNDGTGVFTDESAERGLLTRRGDRDVPVMKALGICFEDVNNDGSIDILVANDTTPNRLFINDGDGFFNERGAQMGFSFDIDGKPTGAMGIDMGYTRNKSICAIGNFANEPSSIYFQDMWGNTNFIDQSAVSGVGPETRNSLTFGTLFLDVDLDGEIDLLQVNGHIEPEISRVQGGQSYEQRAQLFRGTGSQPAFIEVPASELGDLAAPIVGRAASSADLDGDGDLDLVISRIDGVPLILRNDLDHSSMRTITVRLRSKNGAPTGVGATVTIWTDRNRWHRQTVSPTRSYMSQIDTTILIGMDANDGVSSVEVSYPGGSQLTVSNPDSDDILIVEP